MGGCKIKKTEKPSSWGTKVRLKFEKNRKGETM